MRPEHWRPRGIDELEPAAEAVVRCLDDVCVQASPGAGKTELLAQKVGYLLETGACRAPQRILAISFKRDAAANLRRRARARLGPLAGRFDSLTFDTFTKSLMDHFGGALRPPWRPDTGYEVNVQISHPRTARNALEAAKDHYGWTSQQRQSIDPANFVTAVVGTAILRSGGMPTDTVEEQAVAFWWDNLYLSDGIPQVDFTMINRLARLVVDSVPSVQRALRATYPYVFVDEFQDTNHAQYDFLRALFRGSAAVTAVGDHKQRIMGFAGALDAASHDFCRDFGVDNPVELLLNHRSTAGLVAIQQAIGQVTDGRATPAELSPCELADGEAEIWDFDTIDVEATGLAAWLARDMAASGRTPGDYALLTRQKADDFAATYAPAVHEQGLRLRSDSSRVGDLAVQDLLSDELAIAAGQLLTLAVEGRGPSAWAELTNLLSHLRGLDADRPWEHKALAQQLDDHVSSTRDLLDAETPTVDAAERVLRAQLDFLNLDDVRSRLVRYQRGDVLALTVDALNHWWTDAAKDADSWQDVQAHVTGRDAIALMTVHKAKGLEYDTVIFVGIDDNNWWSIKNEPQDAWKVLLVGLSRAKTRVRFTATRSRGDDVLVADMLNALGAIGVERHQGPVRTA